MTTTAPSNTTAPANTTAAHATETPQGAIPRHRPDPTRVRKLIERRSYAVIATVSPAGHPHAAGVLYRLVDNTLIVNSLAHSRKARNVSASGSVGVTIPIRRVPVGGPPSAVQFQATARVLTTDSPLITRLVESGQIDAITSHGELDLEGSCFLAIDLPRRLHTYGIGMSLVSLIRNPLDAGGLVEFNESD